MTIERFDCTNGGTHMPCHGCYTMEKSELGDYVKFDDYEKLKAQRDEILAALKDCNEIMRGRKVINSVAALNLLDEHSRLISKCEAQS